MGSVDLPDQPDEPSRAERARDASTARPQTREIPDPDERGRAYEATRVHVCADATGQGSYWDEVPKFRQMWADHERRWPERHPTAEPVTTLHPRGIPAPRGTWSRSAAWNANYGTASATSTSSTAPCARQPCL